MITKRKNCKTCQLIQVKPTLAKRLYQSTYYNLSGNETVPEIALSYGLSVPNVYNHLNQHQKLTAQRKRQYQEKIDYIRTRKAQRQALIKELKELSRPTPRNWKEYTDGQVGWFPSNFTKAVDIIITLGNDALKHKEIRISTGQLLEALKLRQKINCEH